MKVIIIGMLLFLVWFSFHIVVWRMNAIKKTYRNILLFFLIGYAVSYVAFYFVLSAVELFHIYSVALSILFAYIISYPAIETDSPSNVILMTIRQKSEGGALIKDLRNALTDDILIIDRLQSLESEKYIKQDNGRYYITPSGFKFLHIFVTVRKIYTRSSFGG